MAVRTTIVDPSQIMDYDAMRNEELCMEDICGLNEPTIMMEWLAKRRLLRNSILCKKCQVCMFVVYCS